jgi:hypothetical protein
MEWDSARLEMTPVRYRKIKFKIDKVDGMVEIRQNIYPIKTDFGSISDGLSVLS